MKTPSRREFARFLLDDLGIPADSLSLVLRRQELSLAALPVLLWQYGLVTLSQLDRIFDWFEQAQS